MLIKNIVSEKCPKFSDLSIHGNQSTNKMAAKWQLNETDN